MRLILIIAQLMMALSKIVKHTNHHITKNLKIKEGETEVALKIGNGYDTRIEVSRPANCFKNSADPNNIKYKNWSQKLNFDESISSQEISTLTNIEITISVHFLFFSTSVTARFTVETIDTRYSMNFNFAQSFAADGIYDMSRGYGQEMLSDQAISYLKESPAKFVENCGDSFVSSAKSGGVLLVTVAFNFHSSSEKNTFAAEAAASFLGIGTISKEFEKTATKLNIDASFTIRALQIGGNTTTIASIFGMTDLVDNYAVINCVVANITACSPIINRIINYSQNDFMNSFNQSNGAEMHHFGSHVETYESIGLDIKIPEFKPETVLAQKFAIDTISEDKKSLEFLNAYMNSPLFKFWKDSSATAFKSVVEQYKNAIDSFSENKIMISCYGANPDDLCVAVVDKVKEVHSTLDSEKLVQRLKQIYYIETSEGLEISMIPIDEVALLDPKNELEGNFVFYHRKLNKFSPGVCWLNFFANPVPNPDRDRNYFGKCANEADSFIGANFYIVRTFFTIDEKITGICGWDKHESPMYPDGGNCRMFKRTSWNDIPL
jgi:hypothetical protein